MDSFDEFRRHRDLVQQPNGKGEGKAWCPWHPDREGGNLSLGINFTKRLVKCWVCGKGGAKELAEAWGIADDEPLSRQKDEIERTYDYLNSDRTLRFQVVRFRVPPGAAKKILQRRPDPAEPNAWIWNLKGVQPSLYRLPELIEAEPSEWVWIVEGEKDVDRLRDSGLVATCNPMGAGKWRKHYNRQMRGRKVAVIPDNDPAGIAHALNVATEAHTTAHTVRLLTLPDIPEKGDVSDWMDAGHTVEELLALLNVALPFEPEPQETEPEAEYPDWRISPMMNDAKKVTTRLVRHGFFVNGGADAFFFDRDSRQLVYLERDDRELRLRFRLLVGYKALYDEILKLKWESLNSHTLQTNGTLAAVRCRPYPDPDPGNPRSQLHRPWAAWRWQRWSKLRPSTPAASPLRPGLRQQRHPVAPEAGF